MRKPPQNRLQAGPPTPCSVCEQHVRNNARRISQLGKLAIIVANCWALGRKRREKIPVPRTSESPGHRGAGHLSSFCHLPPRLLQAQALGGRLCILEGTRAPLECAGNMRRENEPLCLPWLRLGCGVQGSLGPNKDTLYFPFS